VYGLKRVAGIVLSATLLASLALGGSAFAQEEKSVQLELTPSRGNGDTAITDPTEKSIVEFP
jgi:hypothetical protein